MSSISLDDEKSKYDVNLIDMNHILSFFFILLLFVKIIIDNFFDYRIFGTTESGTIRFFLKTSSL